MDNAILTWIVRPLEDLLERCELQRGERRSIPPWLLASRCIRVVHEVWKAERERRVSCKTRKALTLDTIVNRETFTGEKC
jgi:hypothetical protein